MSDPRQVTISSDRPALSVTAWLGPDPTTVTGGYGSWDIVKRPKRESLTVWNGYDPYQMDLSLLIDGHAEDASIETACANLERMARPPRTLDEPPIVRIDGSVPHDNLNWVIQLLRWGDVTRGENGDRVRQAVIVSLVRYVQDDRLQIIGAAARAREKAGKNKKGNKKKGIGKPYVVQKGDTLQKIAAKKLGDHTRWKEIAELNNIRDPKSIKVGDELKMP